MTTKDFAYTLPAELIAQHPLAQRDASRLLVLDRAAKSWRHRTLKDLPEFLQPGDLLVLNNSKVIPARLRAFKSGSGGAVEVLLVEEITTNEWWAMLRPGKRVRKGTKLCFRDRKGAVTLLEAEVQVKSEEGHYRLSFFIQDDVKKSLSSIGEIPLPPYIERLAGPENEDAQRYQTVYAGPEGSVAAPTAGLHFTPELLNQVSRSGVNVIEVTLHVGLGTFAPVKVEQLADHKMHTERFEISLRAAELINQTKRSGHRVFAVGTTSLRVLESAANEEGLVVPGSGETRLFVYPPRNFRIVNGLLTNFHLPETTLLMLVSAFASPGSTSGREFVLKAYTEAISERYRFFSYGDAMLIY